MGCNRNSSNITYTQGMTSERALPVHVFSVCQLSYNVDAICNLRSMLCLLITCSVTYLHLLHVSHSGLPHNVLHSTSVITLHGECREILIG